MKTPCPICQGTHIQPKYEVFNTCRDCGHMWYAQNLTHAEIQALYGHDYFFGEEYVDYLQEQDALKLNFEKRILEIDKLIPGGLKGKAVLEIGSAFGFFLEQAHEFGADITGVDITEEGVAHSIEKGCKAILGNYLELDFDRQFDVILLWDTIEHLPNPTAFIQKAFTDLKSQGMIFLSTGDVSSLNAKFRGKQWRMIHPPTHLHYFSSTSMITALQRAGFEEINVTHPGQYRRLSAIVKALAKRAGLPVSFIDKLPQFGDRVLYLNLFDIMTAVAKKP